MDLPAVVRQYKMPLLVALGGLFLMGVGIWQGLAGTRRELGVEIVPVASPEVTAAFGLQLTVDVAGEVERPGVYQLPASARVNDALVAAGGLSAEADRNFVARFINLAQPVADGMKLFIPGVGEEVSSASQASSGMSGAVSGATTVTGAGGAGVAGGINVNTASASELDTLWGIGEKRAADIIANRPYQTIDELMTKAGVPKNVFERIKDQVSVY